MNWLETLTGTAALLLCCGSYLMRSHRTLTLVAAAGVLMWALHFAAKEIWTPSAMSVLMAIRIAAGAFVIDFKPQARWALTMLALGLTAAGAWWTWQGWVSLPSALATSFLVFAGFHFRYAQLRRALLASEVLWLLNGVVTDSPLGMLAALIGFGLNLRVMHLDRRAFAQAAVAPERA
jgi:hypothetical protein